MEIPQYTVYVEIPRLLFPKTLKLIFFGLIIYLAVWLNFFFLKKSTPFIVNVLIMIVIILIILISTILNYTKFSNYQYRFYSNRVEYYGEVQKVIMYNQIQSVQINKNFFDILFHTGTINLGDFGIKYVPNLNQVFFYVQKMFQMYGGGMRQQPQFQQYPQVQQIYQQRPQQQYQQQQNQTQPYRQSPQYQQRPQQNNQQQRNSNNNQNY